MLANSIIVRQSGGTSWKASIKWWAPFLHTGCKIAIIRPLQSTPHSATLYASEHQTCLGLIIQVLPNRYSQSNHRCSIKQTKPVLLCRWVKWWFMHNLRMENVSSQVMGSLSYETQPNKHDTMNVYPCFNTHVCLQFSFLYMDWKGSVN